MIDLNVSWIFIYLFLGFFYSFFSPSIQSNLTFDGNPNLIAYAAMTVLFPLCIPFDIFLYINERLGEKDD